MITYEQYIAKERELREFFSVPGYSMNEIEQYTAEALREWYGKDARICTFCGDKVEYNDIDWDMEQQECGPCACNMSPKAKQERAEGKRKGTWVD